MAVERDYIFNIFSRKITDFTYLEYTDEEISNEFNAFLDSAKGRFYSCENLLRYDEFMEEFEMLTPQEIEITTEIMVLMWIERQIQDISKFRDRLSQKDYSGFSKANLLDKIIATKKDKAGEVDKLLGQYGTLKQIERLRGGR